MSSDLLQFAFSSVASAWGIGSTILGLLGTFLWLWALSTGRPVTSHSVDTTTEKVQKQWPFVVAFIMWVSATGLLFFGCFQAWRIEHSNVTLLRNEHPSISFDDFYIDTNGNTDDANRFSNIFVKVSGKGVRRASPELLSICLIISGKCDPRHSFSHDRKIGWRKGQSSNDPVDIEGQEDAAPIIISNGKPEVYFVGKDGGREQDPGCQWCDAMPAGKYKVNIEIKADNSSAATSFVFDWTGDVSSSNIAKSD
jgi:hypothetical protein